MNHPIDLDPYFLKPDDVGEKVLSDLVADLNLPEETAKSIYPYCSEEQQVYLTMKFPGKSWA